ncbi:cysteine dioxygenase type 1 [Frankliniella occidentalis]|uniref:Cysteine dioxygenase n=1 Tax=Frankliniella occidentalis TaxID=133901 RepID=A0A9C6X7T4_FRAOC|nr:cysteine dioxygenase type 1 [Frankliniella occidentalis]
MEITSLQDVVLHSKLPSFEALRPAQEPASPINGLDKLVQELHRIFRDDVVNIEHVSEVMASYQSNPSDWKKFAKFDRFRYTRNLVDEGNGKFNLMILCWGPDHGSAVHDHADAHCFMKMLQGTLSEVRFSWPDSQLDSRPDQQLQEEEADEEGRPLEEISRTDLRLNDVCYINDSMGLHRVENPSHSDPAVSLHLYSPPFNSCSVFNQRTGKRTNCNVTFWSKRGKKINKEARSATVPEDN